LVSEGKKNMVPTGFTGLLLVLCLFAGCTPQHRAADLYADAVKLRELGQDLPAVDKLNKAIKVDPQFAQAYPELGKAYEKLGQDEKALAAYRQAVRLDPASFENHMGLAKTYERLNRYPQAAEAYTRAIALDPNNLDAVSGAAGCFLKSGQYVKAQACCEQTPVHRNELLPLLARACEGQHDYAGAIDVYEELSAAEPSDPNVLLSLGVAYLKAGRFDRAQDILVSVTQMRPRDGAALRHLGYCFIKRGDLDQAIQTYRRAIDLNGDDWEAYRGLGVACMLKAHQSEDSRWEEQALRHWRRSLVIKPDQPKHQILEKLIREKSKQQNPLQGLNY